MSEVEGKLQKLGFQNLTPLPDAVKKYYSLFHSIESEEVPLHKAVNRIAVKSIYAPISLPPFPRSAMDGYAVKAEDTFGATPSKPKILTVVGSIPIGGHPDFPINQGEAAAIATG